MTGIVEQDGEVPELFDRRVETGRYEEADVADAASAWAARDSVERIHEDDEVRGCPGCEDFVAVLTEARTSSSAVVRCPVCGERDEVPRRASQ